MTEKRVLLISMRVADLPDNPFDSTVLACDRCGAEIWCEKDNLARVEELDAEKSCVQCAVRDLAGFDVPKKGLVGGEEIELSDELQHELVAKALRHSAEHA